MTDITVTTQQFVPGDRPWLLFEAAGHQGPVPTTFSGLLDLSLFTANTHYPKGFIPSGICLGKVTSGGRIGPYSDAASNGTQTCVGFLYDPIPVNNTDLTRKIAAVVVDCFAIVSESRLPSGHGLDTAGKADLPLIKFRA